VNLDDKDQTCTTFHGDNYAGYVNLLLSGICAAVVLITVGLLCATRVPSATSTKYLVFTVFFVRRHALLRVVIYLGVFIMCGLMIVGPLLMYVVIPEHVLQDVGTTRVVLLRGMLEATLPSYLTVFLVAWHLRESPRMAVNFMPYFLEQPGIEVKRGFCDFFRQTNRECLEKISHAIVKAQYGVDGMDELACLFENCDSKTVQGIVEGCDPNRDTRLGLPAEQTESRLSLLGRA